MALNLLALQKCIRIFVGMGRKPQAFVSHSKPMETAVGGRFDYFQEGR